MARALVVACLLLAGAGGDPAWADLIARLDVEPELCDSASGLSLETECLAYNKDAVVPVPLLDPIDFLVSHNQPAARQTRLESITVDQRLAITAGALNAAPASAIQEENPFPAMMIALMMALIGTLLTLVAVRGSHSED